MRPAALLTSLALLLTAAPAPAQDIVVQDDTYVLQFDEQEGEKLADFIDLSQKIIGRPIRYNPGDMGAEVRINMLGPQVVRQDQFYAYFQSILKAYDYIVVEYGPEGSSFLSVQKITAGGGPARSGSGGTFIKSQAPVVDVADLERYRHEPGTLITTSLPLKYVAGRDVLTTFSVYFESAIEQIRNVENSNAIVVTGFGSHVWGMWQLLQLIDVPPFRPVPVIHKRVLKHASVDELQTTLTELLGAARGLRAGQQQAGQQPGVGAVFEIEPRIIPEPRSNSLLITGDEAMVARIEEWLDALDVEVEPRGDTHVYRLKNTDATEVADVLTRVLEQERLNAQQRAGAGVQPGGTGLETLPSAVADRASNSVIITAGPRKYAELVRIIHDMDVRRPQVLIECAIVETTHTLNEALAVGLAAIGSDVAVASNFGTTPTGIGAATDADVNAAIVGTGGNFAIVSGGNVPIPFIIQALETDANNRVLSRPYLMTNDNQEATISSQDQTSYPTTTTTQTSTQTSFAQVEAGISLTISPTISAGNYLRLRVKLEVSNFGNTPPAAADGSVPPPDKTIREVETPVTLPDGHTAILGGLVRNANRDSKSQIPWFGELPLIGWLFRGESGRTEDTFLYVFITPHIIDTDFALLDEISTNRRRDLERLGGNVGSLTADPSPWNDDADTRHLGPEAGSVFQMPSAAWPRAGESGVVPLPTTEPAAAAPVPVPAITPPPAAPAAPAPSGVPGFDDVFGYGGAAGGGN